MSVLDKIRAKASTAAELRQKLARLRTSDPHANLNALNASRRRLLLEGSERELDAIDAEIAKCSRECDRFSHAVAKLDADIAEAEAKEAHDALTAGRDRVQVEAEACAKELKTQYPKLANSLVALLERLAAAEGTVVAVNEKLTTAGRIDERVAPVEQRAVPFVPGCIPDYQSIRTRTSLRGFKSSNFARGWRDPLEVQCGD
jgi:septation ring formation regulator EzrA